jgi:hypothetical protein
MWISVNDEMPTTYEDVLVTDGNNVAVAHMDAYSVFLPSNVDSGYDMFEPSLDMGTITHWCDLPELP